jgi:DNA helicase-2/ATP-dependent DNA helicase PcrA
MSDMSTMSKFRPKNSNKSKHCTEPKSKNRGTPTHPHRVLSIDASRVIESIAQHAEVKASPGSGKTTTLIERVHSLLDKGVAANSILILSFSKQTVEELRSRLNDSSKSRPFPEKTLSQQVKIATAHSFASSLLKKPFNIVSSVKRTTLLHKALAEVLFLTKNDTLWPKQSTSARNQRLAILDSLNTKNGVTRLGEFLDFVRAQKISIRDGLEDPAYKRFSLRPKLIEELAKAFCKIKKNDGVLEYANLLTLAEKSIPLHPLRISFKHILVDEFQDCSAAQIEFIVKLAKTCNASLFVFGDSNQSIYRFAGASYSPLSRFLKGVTTYLLPESHRLTNENAALACAVQGLPATAIRTRRSGITPLLTMSRSETEQATRVAADIRALRLAGVDAMDIVVLARTKAMLKPVEDALLAIAGMDTDRAGLVRDPRHVLNVLQMVKLTELARTSGKQTKPSALTALAPSNAISLPHARAQAKALTAGVWPASLEGQYARCAKGYLRLLGGIRKNQEIAAAINRYRPQCQKYEDSAQMRRAIQSDSRAPKLLTSTIHAAKGKEWPHVFIVGVTDGVLPIYKARQTDALAEEQNLMFVALTRARDSLRLYHAPLVNPSSRQRFHLPSRFLIAANVHSPALLRIQY